MPLFQAFGCALTAFGAHILLFAFIIAKDPLKVIVLIAAAFFWLLSILCSSIIWFVVYPLKSYIIFGAICSVFCQESFRLFQFKIFKKFDNFLQQMSGNSHEQRSTSLIDNRFNNKTIAFTSGCGFGFISAVFAFSNLLAASYGPGIVDLESARENFFLISAIFTLLFSLMHIFWSIIMSESLRTQNNRGIILVFLTHSIATFASFMNHYYSISCLFVIAIFLFVALIAFQKAGADFQKLERCFFQSSSSIIQINN